MIRSLILSVAAMSTLNVMAQQLKLDVPFSAPSSVGKQISTKAQLVSILTSTDVYCVKIGNDYVPASQGAMALYKATVTAKMKKLSCNAKMETELIKRGQEWTRLSKTKFTPAAYKALSQALAVKLGL